MKKDGFIIYPGKLTSADTFRIGCIGQLDSYVMKKVVRSIESSLKIMRVKSASPKKEILEERKKLDELNY